VSRRLLHWNVVEVNPTTRMEEFDSLLPNVISVWDCCQCVTFVFIVVVYCVIYITILFDVIVSAILNIVETGQKNRELVSTMTLTPCVCVGVWYGVKYVCVCEWLFEASSVC